jgi:hypothetical protein
MSSAFGLRSIEIETYARGTQSSDSKFRASPDPHNVTVMGASGGWRADISLREEDDRRGLDEAIECGHVLCVIGDVQEVNADPASAPYANAIIIAIDPRTSSITLTTSLTGLPPLFVLRRDSGVTLSAPFLPTTSRGSLRPDLDGIADTLRWGHPLDGRTLFADLHAVSSYATVTVSADGSLNTAQTVRWPNLEEMSSLTREEIVREQVAAFANAAGRINVTDAFMSLSGGLDSRTALVALLRHGYRVPCVTMAGSPANLDVQLAKAFCKAYGLEHYTVLFDAAFRRQTPELLVRSAELTGGVSCLSQTADLFLYQSVPASFAARISGNLGNQVGRGGFESLSAYQPRPEVFSPEVRQRLLARPVAPWFIPRLAGENYGEVLFGQEVHFWSIANYVVGSSCVPQLLPYADRWLMQLSRAGFARDSGPQQPTWKTLRARDLRHRLVGTPKVLSFQRQLLIENDLQGRDIPLNWGWRAAGGRSVRWSLLAMLSAADAAMIKVGGKGGVLRPAARWLSARLDHRSALVDWPNVIKTQLRALTLDAFASRQVREAGIFELSALDAMLQEHFSGAADHHQTVSRSLEIALGVSCRSAPAGKPYVQSAS